MLTRIILLICTSVLSVNVLAQTAVKKPVLAIEQWQTKNGAKVFYTYLKELPIVDVAVMFDAGSVRDGGNDGIAAFTSQMIGQGTKNLTADQIAEAFDKTAAKFTTKVDRDYARIHMRSLTDEKLLTPSLSLFATIIAAPDFNQVNFKRIQNQLVQSIFQDKQTPDTIADNAVYKAIYDKYPYSHPSTGNIESIKKMKREELLAFYKQYYVAKNAMVIIVGAVTRQQAEKIAEEVVGRLPQGQAPSPLSMPIYDPTQKITAIDFPANQTYIRIGELGINLNDKDYFPLYVGNYIFGGGVLVSRLFKEVRDVRGLTYNINSGFLPTLTKGPFLISLQTRNEVKDQAITVINDLLRAFINSGPTEQELTSAKQNIIGAFPLRLDSNASILAQLTLIAFYHLPIDYLDKYQDNINKLTLENVKSAFRQHIDADRMVTVLVGPTNVKP